MGIFGFFNKDKVDVKSVNTGSHGDHWGSLIGFQRLESDKSFIFNKINSMVSSPESIYVYGYRVITEDLGRIQLILIVEAKSNKVCTVYPSIKTNKQLPFTTKAISEWSHVNNIEAQFEGIGRDTFGLNFFATDYLLHKALYIKQKEQKMLIGGFAYHIGKAENLPENFSDDFSAYMPSQNISDKDVFDFIGSIKSIENYRMDIIDGYILTVKLINDIDVEDFFDIELFVNKENMKIDMLEVGMRISGCFWMQGRITE